MYPEVRGRSFLLSARATDASKKGLLPLEANVRVEGIAPHAMSADVQQRCWIGFRTF